ncbi:trypsin-like peptidase domain-containing protein [Candidatus Bathycorpusculum sp.]|uniref:S1C family serine protease n=1 Tax=Candidatus Bathycorpusculum sp. TaxID=2994959 RepID=UPI002832AF18|nr:trypsin-like peptidase domain-containing protein [Candidatus Termitimicrobium sp.]MCL2430951.1 trypsin-like peptidase domain-containing protein [Candidatus Termitimicrobium sp.]
MTQIVNPLEVLKSVSDATSTLIKKTSESVVAVKAQMSRGTGVIITQDGYIVTCNHVLQGCSTVKIGLGEKTVNAKIVGTDSYNDIALLKAEPGEYIPITIGDSEKLNVGQYVLALANPFNRNQPTATSGMVTSVNSTIRGWRGMTAMENVIATDAQLNPGFSGGPLVDAEGKLIGINTAYVWQRGIAIPVNKVKTITDRLMTGKTAQRGYIGIIANTVTLPKDITEQVGLEQDTGVMIFSVEAGSPARQAGLAMGDVLIKFNGKPVTDFYDLPRLLTEDVIGKETKAIIIRREALLETTLIPTTHRDEQY